MTTVGFVGLGNMGAVLAANLVASGHEVVSHDRAGPGQNPDGARFVTDLAEVGRDVDVVVLSLPDGVVAERVASDLATVEGGRWPTSWTPPPRVSPRPRRSVPGWRTPGIGFVDAPVSGGVAGARARTLSVMYAGTDADCAAVGAVLAGLSDRIRRVGDRPGMGQALKLLNNFLSATALAATSEAIAFGQALGLDPATMVEVLNASSGRSAATEDKFPNHVLTGTCASGFANSLMAKDVRLYLEAVRDQAGPSVLAPVTAAVWERFAEAEPGADFTRIFPFVEAGLE